jgi:hypothetical protein
MVGRLIFFFSFLTAGALAQETDYSLPERLSSAINSPAEESMPLLSPDGKTFFFTKALFPGNIGGKYSGHDIWVSELSGTTWSRASNTKIPVNTKNNNAVVGVNPTGTILYLMDVSSSKKINGLYFTKKEGTEWTNPELIPIPGIESASFVSFYVSPDFDVIFISMKGSDTQGEEDLYISVKDSGGQWGYPRNLGTAINTPGFEISPFLSADKKKLYFSSNGHPGQGDADIFVSERLYESWEVWSAPQNLGGKINSPSFDAFFSTYGDSIAFLASNRGGKSSDIFMSRISHPVAVVKKEAVRQYLSDQEVENLGVTQTNLIFPPSVSDLSEEQKATLNIISRMLFHQKDLRCALVALKNPDVTDLEVYKKRLLAILGHLKKNGLEGSRITFGIEKSEKLSPQDNESVLIRFYH